MTKNAAAQPGCLRCESLPAQPDYNGQLYISTPIRHTQAKIEAALTEAGCSYQMEAGLLMIQLVENRCSVIAGALKTQLTTVELADSKAFFLEEARAPTIHDMIQATTLERFLAQQKSGWLAAMIEEQRLTVAFQPIVHCARPGEIYAYECLLRGNDAGRVVYPGELLDIAQGADLLFQLDLAARRTAIREAERFGLKCKIFINFTPTSIYDPRFCLQSTVRAIKEAGIAPHQVVFEVIESAHVTDISHLCSILDFYRQHGFGVALDDIGSGYSSLNMLHRLRPDYIKLDMELIRDVHKDAYKAVIAGKLLETARALGIQTVAEGIETAEEYQWCVQHGADYGQGYYFARPASPPPQPKI